MPQTFFCNIQQPTRLICHSKTLIDNILSNVIYPKPISGNLTVILHQINVTFMQRTGPSFIKKLLLFFQLPFGCLTVNFEQLSRGSLTHLILITAFSNFQPERRPVSF